MQSIFNFINIPLGYVMKFLSGIFGGNFALSVFAFTLIINLVLIPLTVKSQKSSVSQMRIKPKLDDLKKRYGDDRQKMAQAQQQLYKDEGVSMSGGCLPMIVRMVLLLSIYWLIMSPLTYMAGADKDRVNNVTTAINTALTDLKKNDEDAYKKFEEEGEIKWKLGASNSYELSLIGIIRDNRDFVRETLSEKQYSEIEKDYEYTIKIYEEANIKFDLFGIDLTKTPSFSFDIFNNWEPIWLLPIIAFLAQMLTSVVSMRINKRVNPDAPQMAGMLLFMPVLSLIIGFQFPGGVCFYWICSSLIGGAIQSAVQILYGPHKLLARQRAKELSKVCDFESGQRKKFETE